MAPDRCLSCHPCHTLKGVWQMADVTVGRLTVSGRTVNAQVRGGATVRNHCHDQKLFIGSQPTYCQDRLSVELGQNDPLTPASRHASQKGTFMIPAQPGRYHLLYEGDHPDGTKYRFEGEEVVAWADDGTPLVLDEKLANRRKLKPGSHASNYIGIHEAIGDAHPAQLIPGGGWMVEYTLDDGTKSGEPIIAWALDVAGSVSPLVTDPEGWVHSLTGLGGKWRLYHPGAYEVAVNGQRWEAGKMPRDGVAT